MSQIQADLKKAQLSKEEIKVSTLRLLLSEIYNSEIQKGKSLLDQDVVFVIQGEIKKRKEAAASFKYGGRNEQAEKEETEAKILSYYLPDQLSNEELTAVVEQAIKEVGATSLQDMGQVMGVVMGNVQGRADGGGVSAKVKEKLGG